MMNCRGLSEKTVKSAADVLKLMQKAQHQRKIGETKLNKHSSRSHCIFTICIKAKKTLSDGNILEFSGKLHMVDLAGSECAKAASLGKGSGVSYRTLHHSISVRYLYFIFSRFLIILFQ